MQIMRTIIAVNLLLALGLNAGCANVEVWERGVLSKSEMAWDPDPLSASLSDHIYFSKEGSSGGGALGGGGCGCN